MASSGTNAFVCEKPAPFLSGPRFKRRDGDLVKARERSRVPACCGCIGNNVHGSRYAGGLRPLIDDDNGSSRSGLVTAAAESGTSAAVGMSGAVGLIHLWLGVRRRGGLPWHCFSYQPKAAIAHTYVCDTICVDSTSPLC